MISTNECSFTNVIVYLECSESTYEHDRLPAIFKQGVDYEEEGVAVGQGGEVLGAVVVHDHLLPVALLQSLLPLLRCGQVCQAGFALEYFCHLCSVVVKFSSK